MGEGRSVARVGAFEKRLVSLKSGEEMLRLTVPCVGDREIEVVAEVIKSGWLTQGKKVEAFENAVAEYLGVNHAVAVNSCTAALHLALHAVGVGPCEFVVVSDFTFPATANVVVHCGAHPVLVDVELATFALDPAKLEGLVSPLTRAVLLVHPFGLAANLDLIMEIANGRGIPVINDAACSLGTTYKGRHVSDFGVATCFSFHPRKIITTGEGGMVVTNNRSIADVVRCLRNHGRSEGGFRRFGFNYRMSDVHAAIGLVQLERLDGLIERRREVAGWYVDELDIEGVILPTQPDWDGHIYQSFVVLLDERYSRDVVIKRMLVRGIETQIGTYALHALPVFSRMYTAGDLPASYLAHKQSLTLPLYPGMTHDDVKRVCITLEECLR